MDLGFLANIFLDTQLPLWHVKHNSQQVLGERFPKLEKKLPVFLQV